MIEHLFTSNKYGNFVSCISEEDEYLLVCYSWYVDKRGGNFYLTANSWRRGENRNSKIYLHRLVMMFPDGIVDHIDGNTLNNCRSNLRIVNSKQSSINKGIHSDNQVGYKGVCFRPHANKFVAKLVVNGKQMHGGYFDKPEDAAIRYNEMAIKHYGEYARLNMIK